MTNSISSPHLEPYVEQVDALREVGNRFWQRGWSLGASSNYSVVVDREPTRLLVTAHGKDKGNLGRSDFALVDSQGQLVLDNQPQISPEALLHCLAAENEEVGAVLHTHSVWSTILSTRLKSLGGVWIEGYEMLKGLSGVTKDEHAEWFPIFDSTQGLPALADQVRDAIATANQPLHGYVIHQRGIYTWGRDLAEAVRHIEIMEFLFEVLARQTTTR